jgi:hypothetical protein
LEAILMFARKSNCLILILGTSEHEDKRGQEEAVGSTHSSKSPLFESSSHAKRLFLDDL